MKIFTWVAIAVVGLLAFSWLRRGISANAQVNAGGTSDGAWGTGMLYARGMASTQGPYYFGGNVPAWALQPTYSYKQPATPISVDYSPDNGISFQYGY